MTFDTWHSAISFDLVQGNMLVSQGKALSPGNEGLMAVNVYIYLFPQLCFICVHMPIPGLSSVDWIVNWVIAVFVGSGCCSGFKENYIFYIF